MFDYLELLLTINNNIFVFFPASDKKNAIIYIYIYINVSVFMKFCEEKNIRKYFSEFSINILLIFFRETLKSSQITHNEHFQHGIKNT